MAGGIPQQVPNGIAKAKASAYRITASITPRIRAQTQDRPRDAILGLTTALISLLPLMTPLVLLAFFFAAKAKREIAASPVPLRGLEMVRFTRVICAVSLLIPLTAIFVNLIVLEQPPRKGCSNQVKLDAGFRVG